jgi:hypothetical protein
MQVIANYIEWPHRQWAKISGKTLLFDNSRAQQIITIAKEARVGIFGIDGFLIIGESRKPDQDHSIDTSNITAEAHDECLAFLELRKDLDLWYELVLDSEQMEIEL